MISLTQIRYAGKTAKRLVLLFAVMAPAAFSQRTSGHDSAVEGFTIAGTVVNAATGEPVRHAMVAVLDEEDNHTVASALSGDDGHFALNRLQAAKYQLTASKRGFRTAAFNEHEEFSSAIVTGPDQDTEHLVFRLPASASLRGVVTADGGDPVEGARVMLFQVPAGHGHDPARLRGPNQRIAQVDTATTDDTGAYEFSSLAAGKYLVAVSAEPWYALHRSGRQDDEANVALDVTYPVTFFDSTTEEASATPIALAAGQRDEANVSLHAVPALRLLVPAVGSQTDPYASPPPMLQQSIFGVQIPFATPGIPNAGRAGTTEFAGVPPGHYEMSIGNPPRVVELDASSNRQVDPADGASSVSVTGNLVADPGKALNQDCTVALYSLDPSRRPGQLVTVAHQGQFHFDSVLPGKWELWAWAAGMQSAVVSISVDGKIHSGNGLTVGERPLNLLAAINTGSARVHGFARRGGKGFAGAMVVLVPGDTSAFEALVRRDQSDSDGSFSLNGVAPGSYTVIAIEDGWEVHWAEPAELARFLPGGVPVTVTGSSGGVVRLAAPVPVQSR